MFYSQIDNDQKLVDPSELLEKQNQSNRIWGQQPSLRVQHPSHLRQTQKRLTVQATFYDNTKVNWNRTLQTRFAINQFTVSQKWLLLGKYFVKDQKFLTYHDVCSQIVFHDTTEEGNNASFCQENGITEFSLYPGHLTKAKMVFS